MAAKKLTPQQQRDRRAKIMLAVLGVVFIGVLGIQVPKLLKHGGGAAAPPPAATTATAPTAALASAAPASSQLTRFTHFAPKDPFKPGVKTASPSSGSSGAGGSASSSTTTPQQPKQPAKPKQPKQPPLTIDVTQSAPVPAPTVPAALLRVNGKKTVLALGATFPAKSPMFRVVALGQKAIWIELIAGSLANGKQTLKIDLGRKVTLKNVTIGTKLVLSLVKPTTAPAPTKTSG